MDALFLLLLAFVPLTFAAQLLVLQPIVIFTVSALAIVPLAKYIGEATEELTVYTGPALGGLLNATFGWTELFIGVVFVAIIGNAAEHVSAITVAVKNKMDLALQVSIGSATQIVMFVAPALVLISLFLPTRMSLIFNTFELTTIIFSVFIVNAVVEDGASNWFEGVQLLVAYLIIATAFYFHP